MFACTNRTCPAAGRILVMMVAAQLTSAIQAQDQTVGGNSAAEAEQTLPTTGTLESRIGPLAFEGGYPTDVTVNKLYDEMDFQRATPCYLWAIPIVSFAKWLS